MTLYDKNRLLDVCQGSLNAKDDGGGSLRLLPAGTGNIAGDPGTAIPPDPSTVFESREVVIDRIVRICVEEVI
ncbi:MAG: hypothetical protein ACERK9_11215 [Deltaproteobacteria bacterium]|jgi:hypothetical protein